MKISDLILMSDVDGTLLMHGENIPERNITALERFTKGGGKFAIATGRSTTYTRDIAARLPINFPCVVYNGGGIYDFGTQEYLFERFLPQEFHDYLPEIMERFPQVQYSVVNEEYYFDVTDERAFAQQARRASRNPHARKAKLQDLRGQWYKVVTLIDEQMVPEVLEFVNGRYSGVRFVCTNPYMLEMLPDGSTKASALVKLMELKGFSREQLVCIGDYYNDREMIEEAGLGVTLETSPQDLKAIARHIVGPCENGAVADLVEYLEEVYGY